MKHADGDKTAQKKARTQTKKLGQQLADQAAGPPRTQLQIEAAASRCWLCWHAPCDCPEGMGMKGSMDQEIVPYTKREATS